MPEINVEDHLSRIHFSNEQRENVAKVLAALISDGVARELKAKVSPERPTDDTAAEPTQAAESKRKKKS